MSEVPLYSEGAETSSKCQDRRRRVKVASGQRENGAAPVPRLPFRPCVVFFFITLEPRFE
jgi:hypothetical protein